MHILIQYYLKDIQPLLCNNQNKDIININSIIIFIRLSIKNINFIIKPFQYLLYKRLSIKNFIFIIKPFQYLLYKRLLIKNINFILSRFSIYYINGFLLKILILF